LAMSLRPGSSAHPDSVTTRSTRSAAPQRGQLASEPVTVAPHQTHVDDAAAGGTGGGCGGGVCKGLTAGGSARRGIDGGAGEGAGVAPALAPHPTQKFAPSGILAPQCVQNISALLRFVMHVHGLNSDAPRPGHFRQAHGRAAEQSRAQPLKLHIHGHG
jgi:hypothetical protein